MKIEITNAVSTSNPKNTWRIHVNTMTGDADAFNGFCLDFTDKAEFIKVICYCEVLAKQYPNGCGGSDTLYNHLSFFEEYFEDYWEYNDYDYMDTFDYYKHNYFDENGVEYDIICELDDEDTEIIDSYEVKR